MLAGAVVVIACYGHALFPGIEAPLAGAVGDEHHGALIVVVEIAHVAFGVEVAAGEVAVL